MWVKIQRSEGVSRVGIWGMSVQAGRGRCTALTLKMCPVGLRLSKEVGVPATVWAGQRQGDGLGEGMGGRIKQGVQVFVRYWLSALGWEPLGHFQQSVMVWLCFNRVPRAAARRKIDWRGSRSEPGDLWAGYRSDSGERWCWLKPPVEGKMNLSEGQTERICWHFRCRLYEKGRSQRSFFMSTSACIFMAYQWTMWCITILLYILCEWMYKHMCI